MLIWIRNIKELNYCLGFITIFQIILGRQVAQMVKGRTQEVEVLGSKQALGTW